MAKQTELYRAGCLLAVGICLGAPAAAQEPSADDADAAALAELVQALKDDAPEEGTAWPGCQWCPPYTIEQGRVDLGFAHQDEDSARFGRYTGRDEEGLYGLVGAAWRSRGENGGFTDAWARELGLESREAGVRWGRQGQYELSLSYDQIPNLMDDSAVTPYRDYDDASADLPGNWESAARTDQMGRLEQSLHAVRLETQRREVEATFSYRPFQRWEVSGSLQHRRKEGRRPLGVTFGFGQTAILPVPVDYETNQVELALGYRGDRLQTRVGYTGSFFREDHDAFTWRNAFADADDPNGSGRAALPPDNQWHQLSAAAGYDLSARTRIDGRLAVGRMSQDEDFVPYTSNPAVPTDALPENSLGGEVNTTLASLGVASRPSDRLRVSADYSYSERDNQTDRNQYAYVVTDLGLSADPRENRPYGFEQHLLRTKAAYRLSRTANLSAGLDLDRRERTFQAVEETDERTLWAKFDTRLHQRVQAALEYRMADRDASGGDADATSGAQNPLLVRYHLADRDRRALALSFTFTPADNLSIGLSTEAARDDYDAALGLQEADSRSYTLDLNYMLSERLTGYAFYTREHLESDQAGQQSGAEPLDWLLSDRHVSDTFGLGATYTAIPDRLDLELDLVFSNYRGETEFADAADYPDLDSDLISLRLTGRYRLREDLSLRLMYLHEQYQESDWSVAGEPDALPSVLGLGTDLQDYDADVIGASLRYEF